MCNIQGMGKWYIYGTIPFNSKDFNCCLNTQRLWLAVKLAALGEIMLMYSNGKSNYFSKYSVTSLYQSWIN